MSVGDEETPAAGGRGDGYRSPALSRLKEPSRPTAPIRRIAQTGRQLPGEAAAARLATLEEQLVRLEEQQHTLVANLCEAYEAFSRLAKRVETLAEQLGELRGGPADDG